MHYDQYLPRSFQCSACYYQCLARYQESSATHRSAIPIDHRQEPVPSTPLASHHLEIPTVPKTGQYFTHVGSMERGYLTEGFIVDAVLMAGKNPD